MDFTLSYFPLTASQVLQEALDRSSLPADLLGDLDAAADRYNELWLTLEQSAKSTNALRIQIMTVILDESGIADEASVLKISEAFGDVRHETGVLAYPGVGNLLTDLKPRYQLGLLTNGPTDLQWNKIEALGFDKLFDAIIVAGDVGVYKPDVRVFEMLLGKLGVTSEHSLFVGDTYATDILGAHDTGMYTAWITEQEDALTDGVLPTLVKPDTSLLREVLL
ncbi:HAD-IA family hydrolase [Candidatus Bipolaricaulota bacterium]|nr:HAD-IA family hydrolase [Candidatus Bipolaricaulota bacterium]